MAILDFIIDKMEDLTIRPTKKQRVLNKTKLCYEWEKSQTCSHGESCKFAHGLSVYFFKRFVFWLLVIL